MYSLLNKNKKKEQNKNYLKSNKKLNIQTGAIACKQEKYYGENESKTRRNCIRLFKTKR